MGALSKQSVVKPLPREPLTGSELGAMKDSLNKVIRVLNSSVVGKLEEIEGRLDRLEK